jgi:hypothetical protein
VAKVQEESYQCSRKIQTQKRHYDKDNGDSSEDRHRSGSGDSREGKCNHDQRAKAKAIHEYPRPKAKDKRNNFWEYAVF